MTTGEIALYPRQTVFPHAPTPPARLYRSAPRRPRPVGRRARLRPAHPQRPDRRWHRQSVVPRRPGHPRRPHRRRRPGARPAGAADHRCQRAGGGAGLHRHALALRLPAAGGRPGPGQGPPGSDHGSAGRGLVARAVQGQAPAPQGHRPRQDGAVGPPGRLLRCPARRRRQRQRRQLRRPRQPLGRRHGQVARPAHGGAAPADEETAARGARRRRLWAVQPAGHAARLTGHDR